MLRRRYYGDVTVIGDRYFTAHDGTEDHVYRELKKVRGTWRRKFRGRKHEASTVGVHELLAEVVELELRCSTCHKFKIRHAEGCPMSDDLGPWHESKG